MNGILENPSAIGVMAILALAVLVLARVIGRFVDEWLVKIGIHGPARPDQSVELNEHFATSIDTRGRVIELAGELQEHREQVASQFGNAITSGELSCAWTGGRDEIVRLTDGVTAQTAILLKMHDELKGIRNGR